MTASDIKKNLNALINDLQESTGESAERELDLLKAQDATLKEIGKKIKAGKSLLKKKTRELEDKLQTKRLGGDGYENENRELIHQVEIQLLLLDSKNKTDRKKITALNRDTAALEERVANTEAVLEAIGGQLTDDEAKNLILKKLYDIVSTELENYLNSEIRHLIYGVENLWNKYAVSNIELEHDRKVIIRTLEEFMSRMGYSP